VPQDEKGIMNNLQKVCETLLSNADLSLSVDGQKGEIRLEFHPSSYDGKVTFMCLNYSRLNYRKDSDDENCIFIGETRVRLIEDKEHIAQMYRDDGWKDVSLECLKPVILV
jgi:hypothetical protein